MHRTHPHPLAELARLFFRLGATSFGGPAAHIALMEHEVVRRRGWISPQEFLDLVGAANLVPGPTSTELAIHIGWTRGGWAGLLVAGFCFIAPAAAITLVLALAYVRYGARPEFLGVLYGVKPVLIAVVGQALVRLGRTALRTRAGLAVAIVAAGLTAAGVNELAVLFGAGLVLALGTLSWPTRRRPSSAAGLWLALPSAMSVGAAAPVAVGLPALFLSFLKIGSVLYGSGYVLLAFLRADLVERRGWLTDVQLLDAVAVGQVTPGPVFTTATFIGYVLGGVPGSVLATLGIFLPSFAFVALSGPLIPRLRRSRAAGAFLDGVNAASLALMAVVTCQLARAAIVDGPTLALTVASALVLARYSVNSIWLVLVGAGVGLARSMFG